MEIIILTILYIHLIYQKIVIYIYFCKYICLDALNDLRVNFKFFKGKIIILLK